MARANMESPQGLTETLTKYREMARKIWARLWEGGEPILSLAALTLPLPSSSSLSLDFSPLLPKEVLAPSMEAVTQFPPMSPGGYSPVGTGLPPITCPGANLCLQLCGFLFTPPSNCLFGPWVIQA